MTNKTHQYTPNSNQAICIKARYGYTYYMKQAAKYGLGFPFYTLRGIVNKTTKLPAIGNFILPGQTTKEKNNY